jgi:hypothetical protein
MKRVILPLTLLLAFAVTALADDRDVELAAIQAAIAEAGLQWTAGHNPIFDLPDEERMGLLGADIPVDHWDEERSDYTSSSNRFSLDWNDYDGHDWVTGVRNQGQCGSCWDFGALGAFESSVLLALNQPDTELDLSEQFVLSCLDDVGYGSSCNGGWGHDVYNFIRDYGVPLESCFPYEASHGIPCSGACNEYEEQLLYLGDFHEITGDWVDVEAINEALVEYGPVCTVFWVYSDFNAYTGGVYQHTYGGHEGGHLVEIVGFDNNLQCWIVKNSWGGSWGEEGFFRIAYESNCGFGSYTLAPQYFPPESVSLNRVIIDDDNSGPSDGDNDQVINPGETIEMRLRVYNRMGTLPAGTAVMELDGPGELIENEIEFTTLNQGDVLLSESFVFNCDADVDDGDIFHFTVTLQPDGIDPIVLTFTRMAGAPVLAWSESWLDDGGTGNGDSYLNPGEEVDIWLTIMNQGGDVAQSISGWVETEDPYVSLQEINFSCDDIPESDWRMSNNAIVVDIAADCPVNHEVALQVHLESNNGRIFEDNYTLLVHGLDLQFHSRNLVSDSNNNGQIDPGETAEIEFRLTNTFEVNYSNVTMTFAPVDEQQLTCNSGGEVLFNSVPAGVETTSSTTLSVTIDSSLPVNSFPVVDVTLHCDSYPDRTLQLIVPVADVKILNECEGVMENMMFEDVMSSWHRSINRSTTAINSFYLGDEETNLYEPWQSSWVTLILEDANPDYVVSFNSWLDLAEGDEVTLRMVHQNSGGWVDLANITAERSWQHYEVPLELSETIDVVVRFAFQSDGEQEAEGWYLDDIIAYDGQGFQSVDGLETPTSFTVSANYPNPFNPATTIRCTLPQPADLSMQVYDLMGRQIAVSYYPQQAAGQVEIVFDGNDLSSGVYFYTIQAATVSGVERSAARKMLLVK